MDAAIEKDVERETVESAQPSAEATEKLPASVRALIEPINGGAGEDPRYSDRFVQIKQEIDRLSGANFELVMNLSREILESEGKDLRIAGYLILSTLYCRGISGLMEAVSTYRHIAEKFWGGCFPLKSSARTQAIAWLNSDRMETFFQQQNENAAPLEDLQGIRKEIDLLNQIVRKNLGEDAPQWSRINAWLDNNLAPQLAQKNSIEQEQDKQDKRLTREQTTPAADAPLTEDRAEQLVGKIAAFYRERGERTQSMALSRAIRWGGLRTPPNEGGQTRIPAIRANALNEIATMRSAATPLEQVFVACENLLMEPGAQWSMDLQHVVHEVLAGLNDQASLQLLESELRGLLLRCPGMADLSYDQKIPFASDATKEWLKGLATTAATEEDEEAPQAAPDDGSRAIIINASKACTGENLAAGLEVLKELPSETGRQKFVKRIEEAKLCIKTRHAEFAMPMLDALAREIEQNKLSIWEPGLAISVWRLQLKLLGLELPKANSTQQEELKKRIKEINASICIADPYEAACINKTIKEKGVKHG